jgi:DNA topoisomerase-3
MLELYTPEDYDERYKKWRLEDLPTVHIPWKYKPIQGRGKQLKIIKSLIDQASVIVHAGDTDGEGQLLVDEILENYGVTKPVKRILINDNNERMIRKSLADLRDNTDFYGLSQSALARSVGDQLYGFNMTRLYTLKAKEKGAEGVFSVGRVQTPILGLIVRRDREIAKHTKAYFYTVSGQFDVNNVQFKAVFKPSEQAPLDDSGRINNEDYATGIAAQVSGKKATVTQAKTEDKQEPPPLPYDLLELQADASRKFNIKPDQTLKITQQLREKKLITYNRSDCRYLNEEQHEDAPLVLATIAENAPVLAGPCSTAQPSIKSRCFNSRNVTAHHAIIPTE